MKTFYLTILAILMINIANSKEIIVEVRNVRGDVGNILLMGTYKVEGEEQIKKMQKAQKGKVEFKINIPDSALEVKLSIMHDENGNFEMDTGEYGVPIEGYVLKSVKTNEPAQIIITELTYPKFK